MPARLRVVLVKPSKYAADGCVERFRWGFMPNSTLAYLESLTPAEVDGAACSVETVDEYVETDLTYLSRLRPVPGVVKNSSSPSRLQRGTVPPPLDTCQRPPLST